MNEVVRRYESVKVPKVENTAGRWIEAPKCGIATASGKRLEPTKTASPEGRGRNYTRKSAHARGGAASERAGCGLGVEGKLSTSNNPLETVSTFTQARTA